MTEEVQTATPAEVQTEQVQEVEQQVSSEATTEQPQETEQATEQKEKKVPWFQQRISEVTREKYEAKRQAEQAAQEAQQLREQIARLQAGEQIEQPQVDVDTLAQQKAAQLLAEQSFTQACNKVYEQGKSEFQNFDQALSNLHMVGINRAFLELTAASDAGHKLIHHLGSDLDEASRIASLPPLQMARELTKLELELSKPAAKPVSKAPAPISPVAGAGKPTKDPTEMTDAEFAEWRRSYKKS